MVLLNAIELDGVVKVVVFIDVEGVVVVCWDVVWTKIVLWCVDCSVGLEHQVEFMVYLDPSVLIVLPNILYLV